jgi:hypothetical protein
MLLKDLRPRLRAKGRRDAPRCVHAKPHRPFEFCKRGKGEVDELHVHTGSKLSDEPPRDASGEQAWCRGKIRSGTSLIVCTDAMLNPALLLSE